MTYATSNPPRGIPFGMSGPTLWYYSDGDTNAAIDATDYFSDGDDLGMAVGDPLVHFDTAGVMTWFFVSAVTAGGAATVIVQTFSLA